MEKTKSKIRELRISKNLTQQQLADELHLTKQAISKWEKGKSIPDITSIELLSSFFGVSVDYLINDDIEEVKTKMAGASSKRINKLSVILIFALAFMTAAVIALSITLGVLSNKNKSGTIAVNGFEITYLSDETDAIDEDDTAFCCGFMFIIQRITPKGSRTKIFHWIIGPYIFCLLTITSVRVKN